MNAMGRRYLVSLILAGLIAGGCTTPTSPPSSGAPAAGAVVVPRAWLRAQPCLELAARQAGLRYAVAPREFDGLVGPFKIDDKPALGAFLDRVAEATGTEISRRGDVIVFDAKLSAAGREQLQRAMADIRAADAGKRRAAAFALGESRRVEAIPALIAALGDADRSARRAAVLALSSYEGHFDHNQWAGRVSVFELAGVRLDSDTLLWIVEEAAPAGGDEWKAAVSLLARAREPQLPRAIWRHPWNRTPGTTMPVIRAVGRCGDPDVRAMLEKRVRDTFTNNPADRYEAAAALGKLGSVGSLRDHALPREKGGQPPEVRAAAVYGLGLCRGAAVAIDTLKAALADPDPRVREVAVFALGEMDTPEAAGMLSSLLADEKAAASLRGAAARAIARAGGDKALAALTAAAKSPDPSVRTAAADALGDLGGWGAAGALGALAREETDKWARAAASEALASLGVVRHSSGPAAAQLDPGSCLTPLLADTRTDLDIRIAIVVGMGRGRAPEWGEPLSRIALDASQNHRLRKYAARSLAMLANRAGQPALQKLLESEPPVRMSDVPLRYLDLGDADRTTAYLARWLTGGSPDEQTLAAERIGELGTPDGVRLMVGAFDAFNNHSRWTQEWSLIRSGGPAVRRTLIELLQASRRRGVRMNAALALGGRRDPAAVEALIAATKDGDASVRKAAANSLGECGDPAAAPALIELMEKDADLSAVHQALRALRLREFAELREVDEAFARVRGTERDAGIPGGPGIAEQPANSWVLRRWQADFEDTTLPNLTYESALVYDAGRRRIVQWGSHGRRADTPQTGMTWIFDTAAQSWRRPTPRQEPPGVCITRGLTADPARDLVISPAGVGGGHGWIMVLRKHVACSVPWVFESRTEEWFPMHPFFTPGGCTEATTCFDLRNDVMLLGNLPLIYDPHVNQWIQPPPAPAMPDRFTCAPGAYDPATGRFVMAAGADVDGRVRTWAHDLASGRWTDLAPTNAPPPIRGPMVYDSANDVMLVFRPHANRMFVYAYHLRENRWEEMPASFPSPSYVEHDVAYDPVHNVAVMSGGWEWGQSGAVTTRETWTYRYKRPATEPKSAAPRNLKLNMVSAGGGASLELSWEAPPAGAPGGYHVYRGAGERPWTAKFERLTREPVKETRFPVAPGGAAEPACFRVAAVGADGKEGPPSNLARTQPEVVREVFCARAADGSVNLAWTPPDSPGVVGYNVYRAPCEQMDLWLRTFSAEKNEKKGNMPVKLTDKPVTGTTFVDRPDKGETRLVSETEWAPLHVYVVRAVNALGQESGPSPATLSIPAAPGPVTALRLEDGRCLVVSGSAGPLTALERGRWLYRMDSYKEDWAFRMQGAPHAGAVLVDDGDGPSGDRRCYFVIAADASGQLGAPSTEVWTHNAP